MSETYRPNPEEITNSMEKPPEEKAPKSPETEKPQRTSESDVLPPRDLEAEERAAKERDQSKIAEIRAALGLEQVEGNRDLQQYHKDTLN
jgi:hypothetical protein